VKVTYYTASDASFFVGLVALLNSLALTGNLEELVVIDLGLTEVERQALSGLATVVRVPRERMPRMPYFVKPLVHRLQETDIAVWIDSDMIVTRRLAPLVERAAAGEICVFPDAHHPNGDRWFPEWREEFNLRAPLRREPYVNAGFFALSTHRWATLLDRWREVCEHIRPERTIAHGAPQSDPLWAADQDALNALLMSEVPAGAVHIQGEDEEVHCHHPGGARVLDERTLDVCKKGAPVTLLHHSLTPKPWQADGWKLLHENPYVRLAPRVLFGADVRLPLDANAVPPWLRPGLDARAARRLTVVGASAYRFALRHLPPRVRAPLKTMVGWVATSWRS
jgi:hypothetical protein